MEAGTAEPVDGECGAFHGDTRSKRDVPGVIDGVGRGLLDVPEDGVIDRVGRQPGLLECGPLFAMPVQLREVPDDVVDVANNGILTEQYICNIPPPNGDKREGNISLLKDIYTSIISEMYKKMKYTNIKNIYNMIFM